MPLAFSPKHIGVVLKVAERCNLACSYCYFFYKNDQSFKEHPPLMKKPIIHDTKRFIKDGIDKFALESVNIIYHGGEPLLLGPETLDYMCNLISDCATDTCKISFGLQTNAVLVNEKWIDVFERHKIGVGVSIDGPKDINDANRLDHAGRGTYANALRGLRLLQEAHAEKRIPEPGLICVANPQQDSRRIYRHFVDEMRVRRLHFLFLDKHYEDITESDISGTKSYMINLIDEWVKDGNNNIRIRFFNEIIDSLISDYGMKKIGYNRENIFNIFTISSDGSISAEDVMRSLDERFAKTGLTVHNSTMRDLFSLPIWHEMVEAIETRPEVCKDCDWWRLCHGGHLPHRYHSVDGLSRESVYCDALLEIYSVIAAHLVRSGIPMDDIVNRLAPFPVAAE